MYSWLCFFSTVTITLQITKILPNWLSGLSWLLISMGIVFSIDKIRYKWLTVKLLSFLTKKTTKFMPLLPNDASFFESTSKFESDVFRGNQIFLGVL